MTKETSPMGEKNVYKVDELFNFMTNGQYDDFVAMLKKTFNTKSEDENQKEVLKQLIDRIEGEIIGMKELQEGDKNLEFKTASGDVIFMPEWERKLAEIKKISNPTAKKVRKPKQQPVATPVEITTSTLEPENVEEEITTPTESAPITPEVTDLISEKPKKVRKSKETTAEPTTSTPDKKDTTKTRTSNQSQTKVEAPTIKDLKDLPSREAKPISSYDELILNLIKNAENKDDFLKNRIEKLEELKTQIEASVDEKEREAIKNKQIESINTLIEKIRVIGFDRRVGGGDEVVNLLREDIGTITNIGLEKASKKDPTPYIDEKKVKVILEYKSIREEVLGYKRALEGDNGKDIRQEIKKFINTQNKKIQSLIDYITANGIKSEEKKGSEYTKELKEDQELLKKLRNLLNETKGKPAENKPDTEPQQPTKFEKIDLSKELSLGDIAILRSSTELYNDVMSSVEKYNSLIDNNAPISEIQEANNEKEYYREEWLKYKDWFINERQAEDTNNTKAKGKLDISDEDKRSVEKHISRAKRTKAPASPEAAEIPVATAPEPEPEPTAEATAETPENTEEDITVPLDKIFTFEAGEDYTDILADTRFNGWLTEIYNCLKREGKNNIFEVKDIKEWYEKYQEVLPYIEKLEEIWNNTDKNEDNTLELMMKTKVAEFMYDLYKNKPDTKTKIDTIYELYEKRKERGVEKQKLKKLAELKTEVENSREGKTRGTELKPDQVQRILELRGKENIGENLEELKGFLTNMHANYGFYSRSVDSEGESNNIETIVGRLVDNKKFNLEKPKIPGWKRFLKTINPLNMWKDTKVEDLNTYSPIITEMRKQNLVDRKDGNETKTRENKMHMQKLLDFISNKSDFIKKYLTNPESVEAEKVAFDEDDKKSFNTFVSMYNVFTKQKYRSQSAKEKAKGILSEDIEIEEDESLSKAEIFEFDTEDALKELEKRSIHEDAVNRLGHLEQEINSFAANRKDTEAVKKIVNCFKEIRYALAAVNMSTDEDVLKLKKIEAKLSELVIRHINKNNFKEITDSLNDYDTILESDTVEKAKKEEYVNALIASLRLHKKNPDNGILQNAVLDNLIEKYTQKLNSLS